jgi:hypothetical protein
MNLRQYGHAPAGELTDAGAIRFAESASQPPSDQLTMTEGADG